MAISLLFPVVSTKPPNLFDNVIRMVPRTRLEVLLGQPGRGVGELVGEHVEERGMCGLDGHGDGADAEILGERRRVGDAPVAREARRHQHPDDLLGAQRVDRDRGDQRRVDPARQPDEHVGETVLAHVVARADHEGFVHLLHRRERRLQAIHTLVLGEMSFAHQHFGQRRRTRTTTRIEEPTTERRTHVDVDDQEVFLELFGPRHQPASFVEEHRGAVEDQLVLAADQVHVEHGHRCVSRAGGQHRFAFVDTTRVVRRRVHVHHQLGSARGLGDDRAIRAPRVLADRDADAHSADHEQWTVHRRRNEVTLFVEHRVVRQQMLAVHAEHAPVRAHRSRVRQVAAGFGESHHRGRATGVRGDLLEDLGRARHERRTQEQVLRWVRGDGQLGKRDEIAAHRLGTVVRIDDPVRIPFEVADHEVELRGGDAEPGHVARIRDTACMAGRNTFLETAELAEAIERSADAPTARTLVTRAVEAHPELAVELVERPLVREGLIALACASRSLSSAVVADASLLDPLRDRTDFDNERSADGYRAAWPAYGDATHRGLRRWKRRELLRIAVRDLLGTADLPAVGRELAALAEVCLDAGLQIVTEDSGLDTTQFAVIGMGKLGGRELNYSSDIDVLFVHDGDTQAALRVARALLATMTTAGEDGIVFRTDADLRPEGRAGPLTRTAASYDSYYEGWARTWEYQALIKARPVAGDRALGEQFIALTRPRVWPDKLDPEAIREIRTMKERAETILAQSGLTERELKRGRGGIRDIEFAVQLLQLVHGRHEESVRSANTLRALGALVDGGYVNQADARRLDAAYQFLRTVEHRLQLYDEQQTHTIPSDEQARVRLARVLGYRDDPAGTALEAFEADQREHQRAVRTIHERLFFAPLLDTLAGTGPLSPEAAEERFAAFGFTDVERTRAAVHELAYGLTRRSKLLQELLPVILEWLSNTPDPDLGLLQLRRLAEGPARSASLATTFRDAPGAAERTCRLLGSSRVVGDALRRQPEFVDALDDDEMLQLEKTRAELIDDARDTLAWRGAVSRSVGMGLRRFKRRELLRIATVTSSGSLRWR